MMKHPGIVAAVLTTLLRVPGTPAQTPAASPEETAKTLVHAIETNDVELLLGVFDDGATVFMPGAPQARLSGKTEIRQAFESLFKNGRRGTITPRDMANQSLGDTAIVTFHIELAAQPGRPVSLARRTLVLHRTGRRWLVVHLHASNLAVAG